MRNVYIARLKLSAAVAASIGEPRYVASKPKDVAFFVE
jgi:hypothetical protein